jgi:hypothetical protein
MPDKSSSTQLIVLLHHLYTIFRTQAPIQPSYRTEYPTTETSPTSKFQLTTMSSGQQPTGPSQPTLNQAYTTPGNPADKDPTEQAQSGFNAADNSATVEQRIPTKQASDAQGLENAKAPGGGVRGAPAGEEAKGLTEEDVGRHKELDGAQMAAPGEGDVADRVRQGGEGQGGGGAEPDMLSDLDRYVGLVRDQNVRKGM